MKEFWVLFNNGDNHLATRIVVFSESEMMVRLAFPNAIRIFAK